MWHEIIIIWNFILNRTLVSFKLFIKYCNDWKDAVLKPINPRLAGGNINHRITSHAPTNIFHGRRGSPEESLHRIKISTCTYKLHPWRRGRRSGQYGLYGPYSFERELKVDWKLWPTWDPIQYQSVTMGGIFFTTQINFIAEWLSTTPSAGSRTSKIVVRALFIRISSEGHQRRSGNGRSPCCEGLEWLQRMRTKLERIKIINN